MNEIEAFRFITEHNFCLAPLLKIKNEGSVVKCWIISNRRLGSNGRQNVSDWILQAETPLGAVSLAKKWMEEGRLDGIQNQGILNIDDYD